MWHFNFEIGSNVEGRGASENTPMRIIPTENQRSASYANRSRCRSFSTVFKYMKMLLTLLAVFLFGCSSQTTRVDNPYRSIDGVLIIAGEGLNSTYEDIRNSGILFIFSQKFSEALHDEIVKTGTPSQCYINRDKSSQPISYVGDLILKNKRDGLAQVSVNHIKNEKENNLYLTVLYNPLISQKDGSSILGETYSERFKLDKDSSASGLAKEYAQKLFSRGYIGEN